jgi:hypothetical protein
METSCSADLPPNIKAIFSLDFDTLIILSDNSSLKYLGILLLFLEYLNMGLI